MEEVIPSNAFMYISPSGGCKSPLKLAGQVGALCYV